MVDFLLSVLVFLKKKKANCANGLTGQCLDIGTWDLAVAIGGRVPDAVVTFKPGQEALGAWQEVKGAAMSVN